MMSIYNINNNLSKIIIINIVLPFLSKYLLTIILILNLIIHLDFI